jgi:hypothetical protein
MRYLIESRSQDWCASTHTIQTVAGAEIVKCSSKPSYGTRNFGIFGDKEQQQWKKRKGKKEV